MHALSLTTPNTDTAAALADTAETAETAATSNAPGTATPLRLSLARTGSAPALLDGAWWPRSRDLTAEIPALIEVLDPLWDRITRITVNPTYWPDIPRKIPVPGHVVKVGWFTDEQDPHKVMLLSYSVGRWDLLVIPPETDPDTAAWLMAATADPQQPLTASELMNEARSRATDLDAMGAMETTGPVADMAADRTSEAVWDSEGGRDVLRSVAGTHN